MFSDELKAISYAVTTFKKSVTSKKKEVEKIQWNLASTKNELEVALSELSDARNNARAVRETITAERKAHDALIKKELEETAQLNKEARILQSNNTKLKNKLLKWGELLDREKKEIETIRDDIGVQQIQTNKYLEQAKLKTPSNVLENWDIIEPVLLAKRK